MSSISSPFAKQPIELPPSRGPALLWCLGACLSVIGLLLGGLDLTGLLLAALLVFLVGLLEWRRRPQVCSIQFSTAVIRCTLSDGKQLEASWPISGMTNRYWVSFAMPTQFRRRLWLTVYCDQLCADDFRHLRVMMRR